MWTRIGLVALFTTGCAVSRPAMTPAEEAQLDADTHLTDLPRGQASGGDAVVRVIVSGTADSSGHICSGSLVDRTLVLTAAHCIDTANAGSVRIELGGNYLPWGRVGAKRVAACSDSSVDLAAIAIAQPVPLDVPLLSVRKSAPSEGEPAIRVGFGTGSKVWQMPLHGGDAAPIIQATRQSRTGTIEWSSGTLVVTDAEAAHGDSGGPILAADGTIIAVASAIAERPEDNRTVTVGVVADACPGLFESVLL
jgi:S1-C subfamily serine protease